MKPIWIVDDDASIRWVLEKALAGLLDLGYVAFYAIGAYALARGPDEQARAAVFHAEHPAIQSPPPEEKLPKNVARRAYARRR